MFAAAVYAGLRKGELIGLRKSDIDLDRGLVLVARSYDSDRTKADRADVIPIATELVAYLETAIAASPSELVFPRSDGAMMSQHVKLTSVLRRAMARAGIVTGYDHVCRRKDCGHAEAAPDPALRNCPRCTMKLWPKAKVRPITFHHLRHTTSSLLIMAGANPVAVQRILRHASVKTTTEIYGHLTPEYLREEIDRLSFGVSDDTTPDQAAPEVDVPDVTAAVVGFPFSTGFLQDAAAPPNLAGGSPNIPVRYQPVASERDTGLEPATSSLGS